MSRIRIVVADQAEAVFYDAAAPGRPLREVGRLSDPVAHLHDRDIDADRPGRSHASVGGARHAFNQENDSRALEAVRFARRIARRLDEARRKDEFERLMIVAGAPFLGLMRQELSRPTRATVLRELHKDLVHTPAAELQRKLQESLATLEP